jgi:hypothetical protein
MPRGERTDEQAAIPLVEGVDYYVENGRWVFTAEFLRNRGYCCGSGCRHCPYGEGEKQHEPQG